MKKLELDNIKEINKQLEINIDYVFNNKDLLVLALTHSSYANEDKDKYFVCNERIEFLGDSVLNIVISEHLYLNENHFPEGEMTKMRANIVCETTLAVCANKIHLGEFLLLGNGEELTGGRNRNSILSDAFESLIGAIYLDGGFDKAKQFILTEMNDMILDAISGYLFMDFKTQFQEFIQQNGEKKISYELLEENGPDHNKSFLCCVRVEDKVMGTGYGKTKKEAEQNSAKQALGKNENG